MATAAASLATDSHANRLATEQSPYLLQHAHNPVDWYPWGEEAFAKARSEDKPIFLSVGYSTCHWCHVMEKESFESKAVADIMNANFVNIKVDREERPDVDKVYMTYVQATSGGGGWPMSVFLTPQLQPIVGGTYFPPEDKYGRPGFKTVLRKVAQVWASNKDKLQEQGEQVMQAIAEASSDAEPSGSGDLDAPTAQAVIESAAESLATRFDRINGGFSTAPKFPRVSEVNVLLVRHQLAKAAGEEREAEDALRMAELTLQKMAAGGIYDHIGGGFSRYSVDELWHVPHFEKMLYDNPQIVRTYLDVFSLTGNLQYALVARGILDYLRRDMLHPEGGFFSAEDADSLDKAGTKAEGAFYLWTKEEIDEVLGADTEKGRLFKEYYTVRTGGNCNLSSRSDPHKEFIGKNCLIVRTELKGDVARREALLAEARQDLHNRRAQRPRPHLDDKVVTAWNGMAIGAFAKAARVLKAEDPPATPSFPMEGVPPSEYLWDPNTKRLLRSFCRQPSDVAAFADDYAYLTAGLLDLFEASGDTKWLQWAQDVQASLDELFWDSSSGGYFSTDGTDMSILLRQKEDYDGAEPAASSIALSNLLRLAALASPEEGQKLQEQAGKVASAFRGRLTEQPLGLTQMACSLQLLATGHLRQVIIAGNGGTEALIDAAHAVYCPDKVVIPIDTEDEANVAFWKAHNPSALAMAQGKKDDASAMAFICQNFACRAPTSDPDRVRMLLAEPASASGASGKKMEVDLSSLKTS